MKAVYESDSFGDERPVALDDRWHLAVRGDYVILLDGTTCLQLWNAAGQLTRPKAIPQIATAAGLSRCGDCGPGADQ